LGSRAPLEGQAQRYAREVGSQHEEEGEMKANVIIRMGAGRFEAAVRNGDNIILFDLNKMDKREQHVFRRELVQAFRVSQEQAR
jgi:hypothetical protein